MHQSSPNVAYMRALLNVITYMMHDITCTRVLPNVIKCMMHDITCIKVS